MRVGPAAFKMALSFFSLPSIPQPPNFSPRLLFLKCAANRHREWLHRPEQADLRAAVRRELRGLRLGCWCEQPGPCHGHNLCAVADADFDASGDNSTL